MQNHVPEYNSKFIKHLFYLELFSKIHIKEFSDTLSTRSIISQSWKGIIIMQGEICSYISFART